MTGVPPSRITLLVIALGTTTAILIAVLPHSADWYGSWGETGAELEDATTLLYPLVAGIAAWVAAAPRRSGYTYLLRTAARSGPTLHGTVTMTVAGAASGGLLLAAAGMGVATSREADFGSPPFLSVLVVACGIAAAAAFGCACATHLPAYLAPVLALGTVYGVELCFSYNTSPWPALRGLVVADGRDRTYRSTEAWMLGVRGLWLLALALLCVVIAASAWRHLWTSAALTSVLATPLLFVGSAGMVVDPAALAQECHTYGATRICLTAARAHVADELEAAYRPVAPFVTALSPGGVLLYEEGLPPGRLHPDLHEGTLRIPVGAPSGLSGDAHRVSSAAFVADLSHRLLQTHCPVQYAPSPVDLPKATANDVLLSWLLQEAHVDPDDPTLRYGPGVPDADGFDWSEVAEFRRAWESASEDARSAWLTRHARDVLRCRVDPHDPVGR